MVLNLLSNLDRGRMSAGAVTLLVVAALPFILPTQRIGNFIQLFLFMTLVLSWNILGYTGYLNFGHVAFYGTGAYILGIGLTVFELPIVAAVLLAGIGAGLLGLGLGVVTLRIRGHYFAIASLMLLFIMTTIFTNVGDIISGASQEMFFVVFVDMSISEFRRVFYYVFLAYAVVLTLFSIYLENSKYGYAMRAIGGDEDLALSLGVNTTLIKNIAMVISTFTAGVIGGTHALYIQYIDPSLVFSVSMNFLVVFIAFIGGVGIWTGPIIGAVLYVVADELSRIYLSPEYAQLLFGILFVIIILFRPEGLTSALHHGIDRLRQSRLAEKQPFAYLLKR